MSVTNCGHQCYSGFLTVLFVAALFRPFLSNSPILSKAYILSTSFKMCVKSRNGDQSPQIMRVAGVGPPLVWKFVPLTAFRNTSLQRAFHGVAGQVICAVIQSQLQEGLRLGQASLGKRLQVPSIHELSS